MCTSRRAPSARGAVRTMGMIVTYLHLFPRCTVFVWKTWRKVSILPMIPKGFPVGHVVEPDTDPRHRPAALHDLKPTFGELTKNGVDGMVLWNSSPVFNHRRTSLVK